MESLYLEKTMFKGKEHFSCLINETTPSAKNPVCQNLVKALNMTDFKVRYRVSPFNSDY